MAFIDRDEEVSDADYRTCEAAGHGHHLPPAFPGDREVDFHALMGVLAGSLADRTTMGRERDYRTYDQTPGLDGLRQFVLEVRHGWRDGPTLEPGEYDNRCSA